MNKLSDQLRKAKARHRYTLEEILTRSRADVSAQAIHQYITGQIIPGARNAVKIGRALGIKKRDVIRLGREAAADRWEAGLKKD